MERTCEFCERDLDNLIKPRKPDTHKGDYGKVFLLCGSEGYTGAAVMSAKAASRAGAGVVYLGVPRSIYPIVASMLTGEVVLPLADDGNGRLSLAAMHGISDMMAKADACLVGCGLSQSEDIKNIVRTIVEETSVPTVLDADGINALRGNIDLLKSAKANIVLTPHAGEFERLTGVRVNRENAVYTAKEASRTFSAVFLLKGHRTVTASPDGRVFVNTTGNPGMAKGGSGDILSGIIVALLGQGLSAFPAAAAGAYIHGKAGDICANKIGEFGMTPQDIIDRIPEVLKKYNSREW